MKTVNYGAEAALDRLSGVRGGNKWVFDGIRRQRRRRRVIVCLQSKKKKKKIVFLIPWPKNRLGVVFSVGDYFTLLDFESFSTRERSMNRSNRSEGRLIRRRRNIEKKTDFFAFVSLYVFVLLALSRRYESDRIWYVRDND